MQRSAVLWNAIKRGLNDLGFTQSGRNVLPEGVAPPFFYRMAGRVEAQVLRRPQCSHTHRRLSGVCNTGADARNPGEHERAWAAGVQIGITAPKKTLLFNFHWFHEFAVVNRFEGTVIGLSLAARL
jgi:hypothetical protein